VALWLTVVINGTRYEGPWDEASVLGALQPRTGRHGNRHREP
jgi:hypothetical protein